MNIKVYNKDLKSTVYTTLVRPQLEYASAEWSPHTTTDITKLEGSNRDYQGTRDYQRTFSVTQMIKDLNWRTLKQRRIDSRPNLMYKIACVVAIPAADYLIPNTRQSRHNHRLAYRQIPTLKDYNSGVKSFPRTIVHWNALPFYIPVLPTVAQFSHAVCQVVHVSLKISEVCLPFNYTNSSPSLVYFFLTSFIQLTPPPHTHTHTRPHPYLCTCTPNPVWCPPRRLRRKGRKKEFPKSGVIIDRTKSNLFNRFILTHCEKRKCEN